MGKGYYVKNNHPEGQPLFRLPGVQLNTLQLLPSTFFAAGEGVQTQRQRGRSDGVQAFIWTAGRKTHLSISLATHSFFVRYELLGSSTGKLPIEGEAFH